MWGPKWGVPFSGVSDTLGITTVQIEIRGAKFQIPGPRCAPHYIFLKPKSKPAGREKPISHPRSNKIPDFFLCDNLSEWRADDAMSIAQRTLPY